MSESTNTPLIMGVLNVTPDSFYDGGEHEEFQDALDRAREMVEAGADIVDVGGESTSPGSDPVPLSEEKERVLPVVKSLLQELSVPVSIDTRKPEVAAEALELGADYLNVVTGFENDEMVSLAASYDCRVVVMHMQGKPRDMQEDPTYDDVVSEVKAYLRDRARSLQEAGIRRERIFVDPGIGFGKTLAHNRRLLRNVDSLRELGYPVLVGHSRKTFIGDVTGDPATERRGGTLLVSGYLMDQGVDVLRVHDVADHVQARTMHHWFVDEGGDSDTGRK